MKHLENYGVQALSTEELKSTDGGWIRLLIGVAIIVAGDWDHFKDGLGVR